MSYQTIIEYLQALAKSYFRSDKVNKTNLLNHACRVTGLHRKTLIKRLNQRSPFKNYKKLNSGAKAKYPPDLLLPHIEYLWISMEKISAKRMKAAYQDWLPFYHQNNVNNHIKYLLQKMSASTLERLLQKVKGNRSLIKGLCSTSPARYMKNRVPINTLDSKITSLGFMQADTVAHCGNALVGQFMNSLTVTDIASTWTQNSAIFTKKALEVRDALNQMERDLPFKLKAINTDSGSEFLNVPVFNQFKKKRIKFTRSRPYKKNDNCYVEQKNFTHVRELFGYQRIDLIELKELMNEIYRNYWNPLQNYFIPTFKIKEKIRIGGKIIKKYDAPKTPYQRVMDSNELSEKQKEILSIKKKQLNPFILKQELERKLKIFFNYLNRYNERKKAS